MTGGRQDRRKAGKERGRKEGRQERREASKEGGRK